MGEHLRVSLDTRTMGGMAEMRLGLARCFQEREPELFHVRVGHAPAPLATKNCPAMETCPQCAARTRVENSISVAPQVGAPAGRPDEMLLLHE